MNVPEHVTYVVAGRHDWTLVECPRRGAQVEFTVKVPVRRGWLIELPKPSYLCALCDASITTWIVSREDAP